MRYSSSRQFCVLVRTLYVVLATSIFGLIAGTAIAQTNWVDPLGGSYHSTSNWSPANVPNNGAESAQFNLPKTYNVSFFAGDNVTINVLSVLDGNVTFVAPGLAKYNTNDVVIAGGDLTLFESSASGRINLNADAMEIFEDSTLTFDGGSQSTTNSLNLGNFVSNTVGDVRILDGSSLDVLGAFGVSLGLQTNGTSSIIVDGSGSMLTTAAGVGFNIGRNGAATLDVTGGATVFADRNNVFVGDGVFGSRLTIDGGSTFTTHDTISGDYGNTFIGQNTFFPATVEVFGGSVFEPGLLEVRGGSDVTVDGAGSRLSANFPLRVEDSSTVVVQGGATLELLSAGGSSISGRGSLVVSGTGTTLLGNDAIFMFGDSASNPVSVQILDGAVVMPAFPGGIIEFSIDSNAELIVDGAGTLFDSTDATLRIGANGIGTTTISNGGTINHFRLNAGTGSTSSATIDLDGGTLSISDKSTLGGTSGGTATMNILPGSLFDAGSDVTLNPGGTINLFGGELRLSELNKLQANGGTVNWNNGTIRVNGNATLTPTVSTLLLPTGTLGFGKDLRVVGDLTLQSTVTLDGGTLAVEGLTNASLLQLVSGTFEWLDSEFIIDTGEALGDTIDLGPNLTIKVEGDLTNQGTITGDGTLFGALSNNAGATLRVEQGKSIDVIGGVSHSNGGEIQILGGRIDFNGNLTNLSGGFISGRGTLDVSGTLTNAGVAVFSAGFTDVFGDVANTAGGQLIATGGATVTYYDDVDHNGAEIRTSASSQTVFLGAVTGAGLFTGSGTVFFEGDLQPGNSPAIIAFGGDVVLGSSAELLIEIGGTTPGSEFDMLDIAATADLGGTLEVSLLGGFAPAIGDSFEIITAASVVDTFDVETLPDLGGLLWNINYGATNVVLEVVTPFSADFDNDGDVDGNDFLLIQRTNPSLIPLWESQYGSGVPPLASSQAVPEPTALALFLLGFLGYQRRNR